MGRNWLIDIRLNWEEILQVKAGDVTDPDVTTSYRSTRGCLRKGTIREFKASIKIRPDAQPIFKKANLVPYALKKAVEKELGKLEAMGIISKTDKSDWAAPIVTVPKADKAIQIRGNYKVNINQGVKEETYPLPSTEDLFATLAGGNCSPN